MQPPPQRFRRLAGEREGGADERVIAATLRDLMAAVASGAFRAALLCLRHPPAAVKALGLPPGATVTLATLEPLDAYPWPGDIRELRGVIEHGLALSRGNPIAPDRLPRSPRPLHPGHRRSPSASRRRRRATFTCLSWRVAWKPR
jgi:DNA-binding NtrC family response regulator